MNLPPAQMSPSNPAAAGICHSINNTHYNGVLVGDRDLAQLSVTKASGQSIYKGGVSAHGRLGEETMLGDGLRETPAAGSADRA